MTESGCEVRDWNAAVATGRGEEVGASQYPHTARCCRRNCVQPKRNVQTDRKGTSQTAFK